MISLICRESDDDSGPSTSSVGVRKRKDSGVNRALLVCIAPGNKESWELISWYLDGMGFQPGKWILCSDLKVMNICVGITSHSSKFPCHLCEWEAGKEDDEAPMRTFQSIKGHNNDWIQNGGDQAQLKRYRNCRHVPVSLFPEEGDVEEYVSCSDCHLVLGVTKHLHNNAEDRYPRFSEWAEELHIGKCDYHGQMFEGRECRKLLANVDVLRRIIASDVAPRTTRAAAANLPSEHPMQVFVDAFSTFNDVVKSCFGMELEDNYSSAIAAFRHAFERTGIVFVVVVVVVVVTVVVVVDTVVVVVDTIVVVVDTVVVVVVNNNIPIITTNV